MPSYDVIVLGLGVMGAAAAHQLAARGLTVCGIEQFGPVHDRGSSHGQLRVIRRAYFEHPDYMPLLDRAYALWRACEVEAGPPLYVRHPVLMAAPPDSAVIAGLEATYGAHALPHERFGADEAARRYPALRLPEGHAVFLDPEGGWLRVEESVGAFHDLARRAGAELRFHAAIDGWEIDGEGVAVHCGGKTIRAGSLVIAAGAWGAPILQSLGAAVRIDARVQVWARPDDGAGLTPNECPIYFVVDDGGVFYGFPRQPCGTMKIAEHGAPRPLTDADSLQGYDPANDAAMCLSAIGRLFPGRRFAVDATSRCMYTMTPDEHFVIGRHPGHGNVYLALGFSGHGFKFAPAVGEAIADLVADGAARCPLGLFDPKRFGS